MGFQSNIADIGPTGYKISCCGTCVVVFGPVKKFLFKSILGHCVNGAFQ